MDYTLYRCDKHFIGFLRKLLIRLYFINNVQSLNVLITTLKHPKGLCYKLRSLLTILLSNYRIENRLLNLF